MLQNVHRGALIYPSSYGQKWQKVPVAFQVEQVSTSSWTATGKEWGRKTHDPEEEKKDKMGSFRSKFSWTPTSVNRKELFCNRHVAWSLSLCSTAAEMDGSIRTSCSMYRAALPPELSCPHEILEISMLRCPLDDAREGEDEGVQGQSDCYVQTSLVKSFCPNIFIQTPASAWQQPRVRHQAQTLSCQYSPIQAALMHSEHGSHALADNYQLRCLGSHVLDRN